MSETNKALAILKTSFITSFLFALAVGLFHSLEEKFLFSAFVSESYLAFINELVMPVSVASIIYYLMIQNKNEAGIIYRLKNITLLSAITLTLIFLWNSIEVLFHYYDFVTANILWDTMMPKFLMGLTLCVPIALSVAALYSLLCRERD